MNTYPNDFEEYRKRLLQTLYEFQNKQIFVSTGINGEKPVLPEGWKLIDCRVLAADYIKKSNKENWQKLPDDLGFFLKTERFAVSDALYAFLVLKFE